MVILKSLPTPPPKKKKIHQHKGPTLIKYIDINKTVVSKVFKYFIGFNETTMHISPFRKDFDETKYLSFLIKDDELLDKYNEIWEKVKSNLTKEFESEPVYNQKHLKAKIKSYNGKNGKISTNFYNNKTPKESYQCICLPVILIHSVFRTDKNCYPEVFLEECRYITKEKKIPKYIIDNIAISSDSDQENSDK